jgi:hypothetical protein
MLMSGEADGGTTGRVEHRVTLNMTPTKEKRPTVTTAVAPSTPLSAVDRCDRCGAQAYLRVELAGGGELLFCAHHAREHGDKLREIAAEIHDETGKLVETPPIAPGER